ncbi:MAG TPA: hypothetical protein VGA03_13130 [Anaerolineales bacterium]
MLSQSSQFQRKWPSLYAADEDGELDDRQFVYQASSDVNGGIVTIGYPYSLLEWCAEPHSSWSLPVDVRRVPSTLTAQEVGAEQIKDLAQARAAFLEALDIIAADGKYGNAGFLRSVKGLRCGILSYAAQDSSCPSGSLSKAHSVNSKVNWAYCYDLNGNMNRRTYTVDPNTTDVYTLTYDAENRLVGVSGRQQ